MNKIGPSGMAAAAMADCHRVTKLIKETIMLLCQNSVRFSNQLSVQGLIGVTIDKATIVLVQIDESIHQASDSAEGDDQTSSADNIARNRSSAVRRLALPAPPTSSASGNNQSHDEQSALLAWPLQSPQHRPRMATKQNACGQRVVSYSCGVIRGRGGAHVVRRLPASRGVMAPQFPMARSRMRMPVRCARPAGVRGTVTALPASSMPLVPVRPGGVRFVRPQLSQAASLKQRSVAVKRLKSTGGPVTALRLQSPGGPTSRLQSPGGQITASRLQSAGGPTSRVQSPGGQVTASRLQSPGGPTSRLQSPGGQITASRLQSPGGPTSRLQSPGGQITASRLQSSGGPTSRLQLAGGPLTASGLQSPGGPTSRLQSPGGQVTASRLQSPGGPTPGLQSPCGPLTASRLQSLGGSTLRLQSPQPSMQACLTTPRLSSPNVLNLRSPNLVAYPSRTFTQQMTPRLAIMDSHEQSKHCSTAPVTRAEGHSLVSVTSNYSPAMNKSRQLSENFDKQQFFSGNVGQFSAVSSSSAQSHGISSQCAVQQSLSSTVGRYVSCYPSASGTSAAAHAISQSPQLFTVKLHSSPSALYQRQHQAISTTDHCHTVVATEAVDCKPFTHWSQQQQIVSNLAVSAPSNQQFSVGHVLSPMSKRPPDHCQQQQLPCLQEHQLSLCNQPSSQQTHLHQTLVHHSQPQTIELQQLNKVAKQQVKLPPAADSYCHSAASSLAMVSSSGHYAQQTKRQPTEQELIRQIIERQKMQENQLHRFSTTQPVAAAAQQVPVMMYPLQTTTIHQMQMTTPLISFQQQQPVSQLTTQQQLISFQQQQPVSQLTTQQQLMLTPAQNIQLAIVNQNSPQIISSLLCQPLVNHTTQFTAHQLAQPLPQQMTPSGHQSCSADSQPVYPDTTHSDSNQYLKGCNDPRLDELQSDSPALDGDSSLVELLTEIISDNANNTVLLSHASSSTNINTESSPNKLTPRSKDWQNDCSPDSDDSTSTVCYPSATNDVSCLDDLSLHLESSLSADLMTIDNTTLNVLDGSSVLHCRASGCWAQFVIHSQLAAHYTKYHHCYGGPPQDEPGRIIYDRFFAASLSSKRKKVTNHGSVSKKRKANSSRTRVVYTCSECGREFRRKYQLTDHSQKLHATQQHQ